MELPPPLPRAFHARSAIDLAPALIGMLLLHEVGGVVMAGTIVETEAYLGPADRASHARAGQTRRTSPMFGPAGHAYVYRLYGMHWAFNVVAHTEDEEAGAVLVREVLPVAGIEEQRRRRGRPTDRAERLAAGPARLCQALGISGEDGGRDLAAGPPLWIAAGTATGALLQGPRVNVAYAGDPWAALPLRFGLAGSPSLSRGFPGAASPASRRTTGGPDE